MEEVERYPGDQVPTVYIGRKNMSFYINVCVKLFEKGYKKLIIEGLGENVKKAVDVANFLKIFYKNEVIKIDNVYIDLIEGESIRGLPRKVSMIRILVSLGEGGNKT